MRVGSLLLKKKKFRKAINPVTVKPWNYKYVFPNPDWPGWQKLPYLAEKGLNNVYIETAIAPLKEYVVVDDKNAKSIKFFFEGEAEPEPEAPKPEFDIGEFGKIGDIKWDGPDVDDSDINLDSLSKEAVALQKAEQTRAEAYSREVNQTVKGMERLDVKAEHRSVTKKDPLSDMKELRRVPKPQPKQQGAGAAPASVQDSVFDYLDEMLHKNVLADDGDIEDVDDL